MIARKETRRKGKGLMPTYRNDTDKKITDGDRNYMEWVPGQERLLSFYIPHEKLGLTLVQSNGVSDVSVHSDWMVSLTPNDPITLELPYFDAFELSLYADTGHASVTIGDNENQFWILQGESHFSHYSYSRCPNITLISDEDSTIRIKQEERGMRNTLRRGR